MTPKSDWHLISPHNITPKSHIKVTRINPLTPESDKNLISPNSITPWIKYCGCENKGNDHKLNKFLIIRQIVLLGTIGNV